ncbi:hypothetical protein HN011_000167 [Eciton burchellii]|nr:hypothetical protein HN011_000167 [Eciton burchellii]
MNARSVHIIGFYFLYFSVFLSRGFPSDSVNRIINGTDSEIQSVPYMLSFMLNDKYACCAAIINRHWALTAAHCVQAAIDLGAEIFVRSGSPVVYTGGTLHRVIEILIHENYNDLINDYDIALIKITPPFTYNDHTRPVGLPSSDAKEISNKRGLVCGWGYYKKIDNIVDSKLSKQLQCIKVPLVKRSECYQDYKGRFTLTARMTCYGFEDGKSDTCKGDSGSPLVNEENIIIGVTSWGDGCANTYSPGVYTDTVFLRDWIIDNIYISGL